MKNLEKMLLLLGFILVMMIYEASRIYGQLISVLISIFAFGLMVILVDAFCKENKE